MPINRKQWPKYSVALSIWMIRKSDFNQSVLIQDTKTSEGEDQQSVLADFLCKDAVSSCPNSRNHGQVIQRIQGFTRILTLCLTICCQRHKLNLERHLNIIKS